MINISKKGVFTIVFFAIMIGVLILSAVSFEVVKIDMDQNSVEISDEYVLANSNSDIFDYQNGIIYFDSFEKDLKIAYITVNTKYCIEDVSLDQGLNEIDISKCLDELPTGNYLVELYFQNLIKKIEIDIK